MSFHKRVKFETIWGYDKKMIWTVRVSEGNGILTEKRKPGDKEMLKEKNDIEVSEAVSAQSREY